MTLGRVLVGDDGSPGAAAARTWADAVADAAGSEVVVATVVDATGRGAVGQAHELAGPPASALLEHADEVAANLVVVGRRGAGGFAALRLGSTAHQVAEHSTRPVAVVPSSPVRAGGGGGWPFTTIVVGHDGSPVAAGALSWAVALATRSAAALVVVHALELGPAFALAGLGGDAYEEARAKATATVQEWCAPLRDAGVEYSTVVEEGGPAGVVLDAVRTHDADLLVVGRRAPGSFPGMGSAAHRALGFAPCPVIVVPYPAAVAPEDGHPVHGIAAGTTPSA